MKTFFQKLAKSFTTRSFRVGGYSVAATAIMLAILIFVNMLVGALPTTVTLIDASSNALFSISEQTTKLVSALSKDVTLYWIVQPGYEDTAIGRVLERYASLSDKVTLQSVDPDAYPTFVQNYYSGTLYNNSVVVECGEQFKFVDYNDIYLTDDSAYYYTGEVSYQFDCEDAITSAIQYVTSDDLPTMYTLTGHGEASLGETFTEALSDDNFRVTELSLLTVEAVPEDADLILINSPQSDLSQEEAQTLKTFVDEGGKLMVLTLPPQEGTLENLESVMAAFGVTANTGVVIEGDQNNFLWGAPSYLLPTLQSHTITDPLISGGYHTLLPMAQGLTISAELPEDVTVTSLLDTSNAAYSKVAGYGLTTYDKEDGDISGPFSLAVAIEDAGMGGQIVWVGSGMLLDEQTNYRISGGNLDFFMNSINWMCQREDVIAIRAKNLGYEYLTMDDGTASALSAVLVAVLPAAYLTVGLFIWIRRKRR